MERLMFRLKIILIVMLLPACSILNINTEGSGQVVSKHNGAINCVQNGSKCNFDLKDINGIKDTIITLVATPDEGFLFDRWEGDCKMKIANTCYVTIIHSKNISAYFKPINYAVGEGRDDTVSFIALGDFGEGNQAQYMVSEAVEKVCAKKICQFALGLGDNMYGKKKPSNTNSAFFDEKFEKPYNNLDFPFYMTLGNHDNSILTDGDGGYNKQGEIQVAYTFAKGRMSNKWTMPERYYSVTQSNTDKPFVELYSLDSNPLNSAPDLTPVYEINQYKTKQAKWFNSAVSNSKADWQIAFAHHPYVSNGKHGNAGNYDLIPPFGDNLAERLSGQIYRKWMEDNICGKADVFIAGHDHNLQFLPQVGDCGKTLFLVSGSGAKTTDFRDEDNIIPFWQNDSSVGFFHIEIKGNSMTVTGYVVDKENGDYTHAYEKTVQRIL